MPTERPLPHELLVAHDDRHSYMQRMNSLAGPGAYTVPSTFRRSAPNLLLRVVQRENYGREFSRQKRSTTTTTTESTSPDAACQLCLVTAADTHRARRDQLRKLLQVNRWCQDEGATSPSTDSKASSPTRTVSPKRSPSPRSRASSPGRRRWATAELELAGIPVEPVFVEEELLSEDIDSSHHQQLGAISGPMTYQHFLMGTSYLERLKKLQRRQQHVASQ
ncbi:hypothetical protein V7S43_001794 [Phytophthora oleae]|uniref:Uncharacterized protein n=1 Tax=Phytophthora oleae TaxID=2107226 RepID=A0ABD3G211_9STRA